LLDKKSVSFEGTPKKQLVAKGMKRKLKISKIIDISEKDEIYFEKMRLLKEMTSSLPRGGRWYMWLKSEKIN
jgi:hypothetical protein